MTKSAAVPAVIFILALSVRFVRANPHLSSGSWRLWCCPISVSYTHLKQIDCVFDDIFPDAVKVGMLYDAEIIHTVAERLKAYHAKNIVLDPVMMSSSGTALLHHDAAKVLQEELFPLCTLVTPNLHEAAAVCSHNITNREDMEQAAREIVGKTGGAVLVKGCLLYTSIVCHVGMSFIRRDRSGAVDMRVRRYCWQAAIKTACALHLN